MNGIDFLADINILVYTLVGHPGIEGLLHYSFAVSVISELELLGKFRISKGEEAIIKNLLADCFVIDLSEPIRTRAIHLRQNQKIKLPDALIVATAVETGIPLVTADKRLERISGLNSLIIDF